MKHILFFLLWLYKTIVSPFLHQALGIRSACRYEETCSVYAKRVISEYGILYGLQLTAKRILSCQSFRK